LFFVVLDLLTFLQCSRFFESILPVFLRLYQLLADGFQQADGLATLFFFILRKSVNLFDFSAQLVSFDFPFRDVRLELSFGTLSRFE
jgi:hypothetical protein